MAEAATRTGSKLATVGSQGMLLFAGYGLAQAMSFARNAILGHALSPRDFGIAASITLVLQLVETLSDLGHDRLIVQAKDGDEDSFVATTHTLMIARGVILSAILYVLAPHAASFFAVPEAAKAFSAIALVPLIKGFMHLDCRRAQRRLDNRPQLIVEIIPQTVALAATLPLLGVLPGYDAVVAAAVLQAAATLAVARAVADNPYALALRADVVKRLIVFGWPILLSALPLVAVYQGDRAIIGRMSGIEALAAYSAAFMLTMVPGLLASRAGHALMLPLFSDALRRQQGLLRPFKLMAEATTVLAAVYLAVFIVAGGLVLRLAFGGAYAGLDAVVAWLAGMWALRMLQAVPGMALMASGQTKPFLIAGLLRAGVLPFVALAASEGAGLATIAAIGCIGEAASFAYVCWRLQSLEAGLASALALRAVYLAPVALASLLVAQFGGSDLWMSLAASVTGLAALGCGIAVMPRLLREARTALATASP